MDCPRIPHLAYGEFSRRLHDRASYERIPIAGGVEITARCNLRCAHCYINLPAGDKTAISRELSLRELRGILDQISDEGCLWLLLTGGEPLVRPDFPDIYTHAKKKGMLVSLFTNGSLITPRIADLLSDWPPFAIEITLHGHEEDVYERVTRTPGSFKKCMQGVELLLERDLPLGLKCVAMTLNRGDIRGVRSLAKKLGLDCRIDPIVDARVDGGRGPERVRLAPGEVVKLDAEDEARSKSWRRLYDTFRGPAPNPERLYQCAAGNFMFHVDPYGWLSICMSARHDGYDLRRGSFREGWRVFLEKAIRREWSTEGPCKTCEIKVLCDNCPGAAFTETGDPELPVEYYCEVARQRSIAFGPQNRDKVRKDEKAE